MKRIAAVLLSLLLCGSLIPVSLAAEGSLANFTGALEYDGRFEDVRESDWFYEAVTRAYEFGLVSGVSETRFAPKQEVTLAEILVFASKLRVIFTGGEAVFEQTVPWYTGYADYAKENGFHPGGDAAYKEAVTRGEAAAILVNALPPRAFVPIGSVESGTIPDVEMDRPDAGAIYTLYRAGIVAGVNEKGSYRPDDYIVRAEIAVMMTKIADTSLRASKTLVNPDAAALSAMEVAEKCAPAVFYIELFDDYDGYLYDEDEAYSSGSGFFLTSDGVAVTNHHVIEGAGRMVITTVDGETYDVEGVYSADPDLDIAIIKVNGTGFATLELGNSGLVRQGERVYAIGSPYGLDNSFSEGVVSNPRRDFDGLTYIQSAIITAPGSSGGPLLNSRGQVLGIVTMGTEFIEFSVPIHLLNELECVEVKPVGVSREIAPAFYPGCRQALDFGVYAGIQPASLDVAADGSVSAAYDKDSLADNASFEAVLESYCAALLENGMQAHPAENGFRFAGNSEALELTVIGDEVFIATEVEPVYYSGYDAVLDLGWFLGLEDDWDFYDDDWDFYAVGYDAFGFYSYRHLAAAITDYYIPALEAAGFEQDEEPFEWGGYAWFSLISDSGLLIEIFFMGDRYELWVDIYIEQL